MAGTGFFRAKLPGTGGGLEPCDAGKIEVVNPHGGHQRLPGFRSHRLGGRGVGVHLIERAQRTFVKTKVSDGRRDLPVFYKKCAVSGHAGQRQIGWIDRTDVPKIRHQDPALGGTDEIVHPRPDGTLSREMGGFQRDEGIDPMLPRSVPIMQELREHPRFDPA